MLEVTTVLGERERTAVRALEQSVVEQAPPGDGLRRNLPTTQVIELGGRTAGTLRLERDDERVGVYGFAVDPAYQGRGIGREVLGATCRSLREEGVDRVTLEVETQNAHALGLYTSLGFVPEAGEDYWALVL